jgi:lysine-N-methylase
MIIRKSAYFDRFTCIAAACPDSCCKEWDVQVDADAGALYRSLPGALGDRLRQVLREEDGETVMTIEAGRCPMWRSDGLCRIQAELGHDALCHTCREFPRLTHDYGDFVEKGLELSCPEAARLILSSPYLPPVSEECPGGEAPEYDEEVMEVLLRTRQEALRLLCATPDLPEALTLLLLYGYHAQALVDGEEDFPFDAAAALESARQFAGDPVPLQEFFLGLEILTEDWRSLLSAPACPAPWQEAHRRMACYFVERYWLQAVSDYDLVSRVKLAVVSCLLVRTLGGDVLRTAQLYSKEIENDADNVDALLDGAYTHPALTDAALLGALLEV